MPRQLPAPFQARSLGVDLSCERVAGRRHRRRCGMAKPDASADGSRGTALINLPIKLHNPVVFEEQQRRAADFQLRIADKITAFAGSMNFVYLHIVLFAVWMIVFEKSPWPTLTLIVSLEAIFLSTFVMIGQNRQASFQQVKADSDYKYIDQLLEENTRLTRAIHQ